MADSATKRKAGNDAGGAAFKKKKVRWDAEDVGSIFHGPEPMALFPVTTLIR